MPRPVLEAAENARSSGVTVLRVGDLEDEARALDPDRDVHGATDVQHDVARELGDEQLGVVGEGRQAVLAEEGADEAACGGHGRGLSGPHLLCSVAGAHHDPLRTRRSGPGRPLLTDLQPRAAAAADLHRGQQRRHPTDRH
jgi:hypothetical protein